MPGLSHDTRPRWIDDPRIRLDPGWSMDVGLPERAAVPAAGLVGNGPFDERVIPTWHHGVAGQPGGVRAFPSSPAGEGAAPAR